MGTTYKTGCVLCAQNCGLEVEVENNRIVKVRGDKSNPKSEGYVCRKGLNIAYHQHHADRLLYPLKKVGNGFVRISWEQAIEEIAEKLTSIIATYGPRSFAYMGAGGQGCHFQAPFGIRLMRALGSQYHYSSLAQEFAGDFWVCGRMYGRQYIHDGPDVDKTDMLIAIGWNGMQSHQIPQAPRHLQRLARDPEKLLVVIDPRRSETAQIANLHLPVRVGADALLLKAMISLILEHGWENKEFIDRHTSGWEKIRSYFHRFDYNQAIRTCQLNIETVEKVCQLFAQGNSSMRHDLGIYMNRHSAVSSYLINIIKAICGRLGVRGGNVFPGHFVPMGSHTDERDERVWRTVATNSFPVCGSYPPNVMPEEILSGHPERLRAVYVCGANPLRSYADTTAYEEAFSRLDLLVTAEIAMTETAALSHYVLPARSGYESWDGTFFPVTFPGVFFQMRRPIIQPEGEQLELGEIHLRLADRMGLIPPIPEELYEAARSGRAAFGHAIMKYVAENPQVIQNLPFVLGKTLGRALGSVHLAALWGLLQITSKEVRENAVRAGFEPGPQLPEKLFDAIVEHPEGIWMGRVTEENNLSQIKTEDGRINLYIPELLEELASITPEKEEIELRPHPDFPLILMAGRHIQVNANTLMRDPAWNEGRRACTVTMHPRDAEKLQLRDGELVRVVTEAGQEEIELEITENEREGHVTIPHGFGLVYQGKKFGANVNRLTKKTHRDRFGTPIHRYVPCRVEKIHAE
ncbi:MAG: molybdopterin-dependent oxidoreductase [Syntrophales bacterium]|nr:molybdopterin-dependent oxidoreductase [Syntrophales bacterium]